MKTLVLIFSASALMACSGFKTALQSQVSSASSAKLVLVQLNGSVTDDGLPKNPGKTTSTWSVVSGPGQVQFDDISNPKTKAGISIPGRYIFKLTASDGSLSSSAKVTINVL